MQTISTLMLILAFFSIVACVTFFVIFIVKAASKKPAFFFGVASLIALCGCLVLTMLGSLIACDHEYCLVSSKEASCSKAGELRYQCNKCGEDKVKREPKLEHKYLLVEMKASSCKESGTEYYKCEVCGKEKEETLAKIEHQFEEKSRKEPTFDAPGTIICVCTLCGHEEQTEIEKLNEEEILKNRFPMTVFESSDLRISITAVDKNINFEVVNNSEKDISFYVESVAINNCMMLDLRYAQPIAPRKKLITKYDISRMGDYGINRIETVDMSFYVHMEDIGFLEIPYCHIDLIGESVPYQPYFDVKPIYEDDEIACYCEAKGNTIGDIELVYYNKTETPLLVYFEELSINGVMLENNIFGYYYVLPGCYHYTGTSDGTINIWSALDDEIEEKGLENIEILCGKLHASGDDTDRVRITTEELTIYKSS